MRRRARWSVSLGALALVVSACTAPQVHEQEIRLRTDDFDMRISTDPMPPHARDRQRWKVVILDRETREPIQSGEGRIFASSRDGANTWDGFAKGEEVGTFYGYLSFLTAGEWAMAVQFRTDSTLPLQRVDWIQEVLPERPLGEG